MTTRNVRDLRAAADAIINSYDAAARLEAMAALEVFSPAERIAIAGFVRNGWGGLSDDEASAILGVSVGEVKDLRRVLKKALPEVAAAIRNGRIETVSRALAIVTPTKAERRVGLTSEAKQRAWLASTATGEPKP